MVEKRKLKGNLTEIALPVNHLGVRYINAFFIIVWKCPAPPNIISLKLIPFTDILCFVQ